jgi:hypothetical protein
VTLSSMYAGRTRFAALRGIEVVVGPYPEACLVVASRVNRQVHRQAGSKGQLSRPYLAIRDCPARVVDKTDAAALLDLPEVRLAMNRYRGRRTCSAMTIECCRRDGGDRQSTDGLVRYSLSFHFDRRTNQPDDLGRRAQRP